ncbi:MULTISPECIES: hypothetical protein [Cyanophyceae]|uniref:hypothetical protein n=1 Tax=Cyanophyceae TaxID=3028117 RepID=UPI00232CAADE|nr:MULTISPECIES: hypothetical protein [Cyanophyceae]MDB9355469.1 hypothetical protein [Nodularia spumigena CS-587/03]MDB9341422.1 hypothetical protein [Nodularia spumigena CS-589/07]MDB9398745.1 hypothetical protein [Microcystis aeruginosa CS-567/02-A1]MDB9499162.1 hypothetical protein [Nodularia spumigena CS-336/02]MDB9530746.1 hypothetical protein [Nodularia spumigena CS-1038]
MLIVVVITAANVSEQAGAKQVLFKLNQVRDRMNRLIKIWVDGGYRGKHFTHLVIDVYRWLWSVVTRHEEQKGFVVLPMGTFSLSDISMHPIELSLPHDKQTYFGSWCIRL